MSRRSSLTSLLLGTALSAAVLGSTASAAPLPTIKLDPRTRVSPALQYGAQVEPDKQVRVIVQKVHQTDDAHAIAHAVHTDVKDEFSLAKAITMEVPQRAALQLARDPRVRYVSLDGAVYLQASTSTSIPIVDASALQTLYPLDVRADQVWNNTVSSGLEATGQGVTVAVLDSGINAAAADFASSKITAVNVNPRTLNSGDGYGHGTFVAGMINGRSVAGTYIGVAPKARVLSVKVSDDSGTAYESDVLRGLQWVYDNRATESIRVVNLSLTAATAESYVTSVLDAAVEQLWFGGVVVVTAAGNRGSAPDAVWYAPANDPYVLTVGALDDNGTLDPSDDVLAAFSSRGTTEDGFSKPDVVAPGRKIYSVLSSPTSILAQLFPTRVSSDGQHIRLSGTSMAAAVVSGEVALLLQRSPSLTADQVKRLVKGTARTYALAPDSASETDALAMLSTAITDNLGLLPMVNVGLVPNSGIDPNSSKMQWGAAYWDASHWDAAYWDASHWDTTLDYD